ncbi:MAG: hypothetical protein WD342_15170 [Verrucomicrobiales bacterium]
MKLFWGDLHNHCAVSYGNGTPERALDNARNHLDFCTVTGHAFWPDLPMDLEHQNAIIGMHLGGFAKLRHFWKDLLGSLETAGEPGRFVALPSYEWHSMVYGDYNCYFDRFDPELIDGPDPAGLAAALEETGRDFMMLPHHCAYQRGFRGTNWDHFDAKRSPLVEIFSNHGCGEADDASGEYHHSMGPRVGGSTVRAGLSAGHRFGFYAGTDSHDGYPGHYGHGVTGVYADRLDVASIWSALKAGRTLASTGARIRAAAELGEAGVGQVAARADSMPLRLEVEGTAPIERVDLIEGGDGRTRVRRIAGPSIEPVFRPGRHKIKVECGWGRGQQCSDWRIDARLRGGKLLGAQPCFRFSRYQAEDTGGTEKILAQTEDSLTWSCRAAANPAGMTGGTHFNAGGTQAMVLDVDLGTDAELIVSSEGVDLRVDLVDLAGGSVGQSRGGFGSPALKIHRAIPKREFSFRFEEDDYRPFASDSGFAYFRIVQSDGQTAWLSPFFYE